MPRFEKRNDDREFAWIVPDIRWHDRSLRFRRASEGHAAGQRDHLPRVCDSLVARGEWMDPAATRGACPWGACPWGACPKTAGSG